MSNETLVRIQQKAEKQKYILDDILLNAKLLQANGHHALEADILEKKIVEHNREAGLLTRLMAFYNVKNKKEKNKNKREDSKKKIRRKIIALS